MRALGCIVWVKPNGEVFKIEDKLYVMSRVIIHEASASHKVQIVDEEGNTTTRGICMCGLSSNLPFCNGSHRKTKDESEGVLYQYNEDETRVECSINTE